MEQEDSKRAILSTLPLGAADSDPSALLILELDGGAQIHCQGKSYALAPGSRLELSGESLVAIKPKKQA